MIPDDLLQHLRDWLPAAGFAAANETPTFAFLGGGISNDVVAITTSRGEFVYKRALPKLRVAAEWLGDVGRIRREAACQRWLTTILAPGEVPAVLAEDLNGFGYLMERAPADTVNWKSEMLAGRVDHGAAAAAGDLLGRIHAAGADPAALPADFADKTVFDQLRLDPYFRAAAALQPSLAAPLGALIERFAASSETLVHGDFSPKNLLLRRGRPILLDHEVAHRGDPCFDLGFFVCHLFLKALHLPGEGAAPWRQPAAAWAAYRVRYDRPAETDWLPAVGACLLARVDGKSPAEYLTDDEKPRVRALASSLLRGEIDRLADAVDLARG